MTNKTLTLGSLFDGSGGFPLGGLLAGITPVWASEIEPFPIRVTTKRLPFMKHYGNISAMSFGKMNGFADIVETRQVKDSEGFTHSEDEVLASVRVYREGRHGSQRWANLAAFSEATDLFRFRRIPGLTITTDQFLICDDCRYDIVSVEDVKGRGMYIEVLAKRSEPTIGKS